jgi:hypothetical protein
MAESWLAKHPQSNQTEAREGKRAETESQAAEDGNQDETMPPSLRIEGPRATKSSPLSSGAY